MPAVVPSCAYRATPNNAAPKPALKTEHSSYDVDGLRERIHELMPRALVDLAALVSFRSVADRSISASEECDRAAQFVLDGLAELGFGEIGMQEMPDGSRSVVGRAAGPPATPTVLLYSHYDVQPAGDTAEWDSPPWELTERHGRWYGRGSADSKGNIVTHLTALRAFGGSPPCNVKIVIEGSEEQPSDGIEVFLPQHPELLRADAILLADTGNAAVGEPALTTSLRGNAMVIATVQTLSAPVHSGSFGGAAPDALSALILMLSSLYDERGNTVVRGLRPSRRELHADYPTEQFRKDAGVLAGVDLVGDGSIPERLWDRPSLTVLGIDCPTIGGSMPAVTHEASARLSLRIPAGLEGAQAQDALIAHLEAVAPWNARVSIVRQALSEPFAATTDGAAYLSFQSALRDAYGREPTIRGEGGSIPICQVFGQTYPEAEILLLGVEEPLCRIHAPNESVDPTEIENMALAEALFLSRYPRAWPRSGRNTSLWR
jgi:cysteinylglycine-S-conjugate dipeptidase